MIVVAVGTDTDRNTTAVVASMVAVGIGMIANLAAASIADVIGIFIGTGRIDLSANAAEMVDRIALGAIVQSPCQSQRRKLFSIGIGEHV